MSEVVSGTPPRSSSGGLIQVGLLFGAFLYYTCDTTSMSSFLTSTLTTLLGVTTIALGGLYFLQDSLLYFPQVPDGARTHVMDPSAVGLDGETVTLRSADGSLALHGLFLPAPASPGTAPTFLFFHGNAGNIGHRLPNAYHLVGLGANVFLAEYRGYGLSQGTPSQAGMEADAHVALDWLLAQDDNKVDKDKIIVFGRSLGGAVAISLVQARPDDVAALVVENTFLSVLDMIDVVMPIFSPFKPLCSNPWLSRDRIPDISLPILFLSGKMDELVPAAHMETLFQLVPDKSKAVWVPFADGTHNETWLCPGYFDAIRAFLNSDLPRIQSATSDPRSDP